MSLFIKTWFTFVATLRDLHPEAYNRVGDKRSITAYLNKYEEIYSRELNFTNELLQNIVDVYTKGKEIILTQYPEYYFEDFFEVNPKFQYRDRIDSNNIVVNAKKEPKNILSLLFFGTDNKFKKHFRKPLKVEISFNDIIYSDSFTNSDEKTFLSNITMAIINQLTAKMHDTMNETIAALHIKKKADEVYIKELFLTSLGCLRSRMIVGLKMETEKSLDEKGYNEDSYTLIRQCPENFFLQYHEMEKMGTSIFDVDNPDELSRKRKRDRNIRVKSVMWFLNFVYRLRNALFHEIIDPLDPEWQDIFKKSYLVLKEIAEVNISILKKKHDNETIIR